MTIAVDGSQGLSHARSPASRFTPLGVPPPFKIKVPMLFLQGTRDALAEMHLMKKLTQKLGYRHLPMCAEHLDDVLTSSLSWTGYLSLRAWRICIYTLNVIRR